MNGTATRFLRLGVSLAALVTLGWVLTGHAAKPVRHSVPTDWSHRHLIFSHPASAERAARVSEDPRYWQQKYRLEQRLALPVSVEADVQSAFLRRGVKVMSQPLYRDWSQNLGSGGTVGAGNYPAKFSFDTGSALCDAAGTPDYVAFSTGLAGGPTQASIVAYDNLYFGCTPGATPLIYWAYNTAGTILTSPVMSLDGKQIAFAQTNAGVGTVVMLKWARGGTVPLPATPLLVLPAAYSACIAPCMTEIPLLAGGGITPTDDTTSPVFYDYTNDIGWVGDASGWLHKITGMFQGTPTEVTTGGFPAHVNGGTAVSSPVFDRVSNNVFVADAGTLYRVDATSGAIVASGQLDFGAGIVQGPIVDSSNGAVYVFSSSDGSGTCGSGVDCAAVYKLTTTFAATTTGSEVTVGDSSTVLGAGTLPNPMYIGGFDSAYYSSNNATGKLYVCGNTGANPTVYQVAITGGAFPGSGAGLPIAPLASTNAACSPVTDIPNPNLTGGFSERMFVSVRNSALSSVCAGAGCILNFISAPWINDTIYAVGQQVLNKKGHVETVMQAGTSALLPTSEPAWGNQVADTRTDGNGPPVIWIDQGLVNAGFVTWQPSFHYISSKPKILDTNGNVQALTTNTAGSLTGASQPVWSTVPGTATTDNQVTWTNVGKLGTAALPAAGGTSGIIVDNTVGTGTVVGGSQIYFTTLSDDTCGGGCAVQASQPGLN
jgi:hypothetical protein